MVTSTVERGLLRCCVFSLLRRLSFSDNDGIPWFPFLPIFLNAIASWCERPCDRTNPSLIHVRGCWKWVQSPEDNTMRLTTHPRGISGIAHLFKLLGWSTLWPILLLSSFFHASAGSESSVWTYHTPGVLLRRARYLQRKRRDSEKVDLSPPGSLSHNPLTGPVGRLPPTDTESCHMFVCFFSNCRNCLHYFQTAHQYVCLLAMLYIIIVQMFRSLSFQT